MENNFKAKNHRWSHSDWPHVLGFIYIIFWKPLQLIASWISNLLPNWNRMVCVLASLLLFRVRGVDSIKHLGSESVKYHFSAVFFFLVCGSRWKQVCCNEGVGMFLTNSTSNRFWMRKEPAPGAVSAILGICLGPNGSLSAVSCLKFVSICVLCIFGYLMNRINIF